VGRGEHLAIAGLAPLDPPMPAGWTGLEWLIWSARLAGLSHADARDAAARAVSSLGLAGPARGRIGSLARPERRALVLAHATLADPEVVVATSPLEGLDGPAASWLAGVLQTACRDRAWVIGITRVDAGSAEHAIASDADDLLVFASGSLVRAGRLDAMLAGASAFTMTVRARGADLSTALAARGAQVSGGPARYWVELPDDLTVTDLLGISVEVGAPVVELLPRMRVGPPAVVEERPG
jgi:ABC-2 type transport system ATP-binding protein